MGIREKIIRKLHAKDLHARDIFRGSAIAFAFKIIGILANYIFTYQVTKNYGASVNGLFNLGFAILTLSTVISRIGLDTAMLRFTTEFRTQNDWGGMRSTYFEVLRLVIPVCLSATVILYFSAGYLAEHLFSKPELAEYIRIISFCILPYTLIMINSECLRAIRFVRHYLFYEGMAINLFNSFLLFVCFFWSRSTSVLIYSFLITVFIFGLHSTYTWFKKSGILNHPVNRGMTMKEMLRISIPMLTSNSLANLTVWIDTLMLGVFRSAADVGVYNIALKIALITKVSLTAVNSISAPKFAEFHSLKDIGSLRKTSDHATKLIFWTSTPVLIFILAFPSFCLGIFGEEFTAGAVALAILTVGQFIASVSGSVGHILNLTGNQVLQQNITLVSVAVNITLNIFLIPLYGLTGAAIASSSGLIIRNLAAVYFIKKKFDFVTIYLPFTRRQRKK